MPTPSVLAYCGGLYLAGGSDRELIIAIAKTEILVMYFASLFAAYMNECHERFFGYEQFDAHEGCFIVLFMAL